MQHHFKTTDRLRRAVDDHIARVGAEAFGVRWEDVPDQDVVKVIGDRITALMRDHHAALLYLVRSAAEADPRALETFDALVAVGDAQIERLANKGLLRDDLDRKWAVLHVLTMNLATALLEPAINRHLDRPLHTPDQLERWNRASTEMFRSGLFQPPGGKS